MWFLVGVDWRDKKPDKFCSLPVVEQSNKQGNCLTYSLSLLGWLNCVHISKQSTLLFKACWLVSLIASQNQLKVKVKNNLLETTNKHVSSHVSLPVWRIVKQIFYNSLFLPKKNHQTTKPRNIYVPCTKPTCGLHAKASEDKPSSPMCKIYDANM